MEGLFGIREIVGLATPYRDAPTYFKKKLTTLQLSLTTRKAIP